MARRLNPTHIAPPFGNYAHGVEIPKGARVVRTSGQFGVTRDGSVPASVGAQSAACFANVEAVLEEAGMTRANIVHLYAYVTRREDIAAFMAARDAFLATLPEPPASTLLIVSGFTREEFLVEVDAMAARGEDA